MNALSPTNERINALNPTERERALLAFVFAEMFRLWKLYRALTRQYRIKDALPWHTAQDKAIDLVYNSNIAPMIARTEGYRII